MSQLLNEFTFDNHVMIVCLILFKYDNLRRFDSTFIVYYIINVYNCHIISNVRLDEHQYFL